MFSCYLVGNCFLRWTSMFFKSAKRKRTSCRRLQMNFILKQDACSCFKFCRGEPKDDEITRCWNTFLMDFCSWISVCCSAPRVKYQSSDDKNNCLLNPSWRVMNAVCVWPFEVAASFKCFSGTGCLSFRSASHHHLRLSLGHIVVPLRKGDLRTVIGHHRAYSYSSSQHRFILLTKLIYSHEKKNVGWGTGFEGTWARLTLCRPLTLFVSTSSSPLYQQVLFLVLHDILVIRRQVWKIGSGVEMFQDGLKSRHALQLFLVSFLKKLLESLRCRSTTTNCHLALLVLLFFLNAL